MYEKNENDEIRRKINFGIVVSIDIRNYNRFSDELSKFLESANSKLIYIRASTNHLQVREV